MKTDSIFVLDSNVPVAFGWSRPKPRLFPWMGKIHVRGNNPLTPADEAAGLELYAALKRHGTIGFWRRWLIAGSSDGPDFAQALRVGQAHTAALRFEKIPEMARIRDVICSMMTEHRVELQRAHSQLKTRGRYGVAETDDWHAELRRFAKTVLLGTPENLHRLSGLELYLLGLSRRKSGSGEAETFEWVQSAIRLDGIAPVDPTIALQRKYDLPRHLADILEALRGRWAKLPSVDRTELAGSTNGATEVETISPEEFERLCSMLLKAAGWKTNHVGGSGDQGADIIAERQSYRVAVQCKRYCARVGTAAVQEAFAARSFHDATHAVVVSTAGYTAAAKRLAGKTGVVLLHHEELAHLGEKLAR